MFSFFKTKKQERLMAASRDGDGGSVIAISTQPLLINPGFNDSLKQKVYRLDAIERYVTQKRDENKKIPDQRMQELIDDYERLKIEIRRMKAQFVTDGGTL